MAAFEAPLRGRFRRRSPGDSNRTEHYPGPDRGGPRVTPDRLGLRALNRAALHRQLLLDRAPVIALDAVVSLLPDSNSSRLGG